MKLIFSQRIPSRSEILQVYSVIVLLIYGWSLYWFIWTLPSWIAFLTPGEIWAIYCYTVAVDLAESVCMLIGIVGLFFFLPPKWTRTNFLGYASSIVLLFLVFLMVILSRSAPLSDLPIYAILSLAVFIVLHLVSMKIKRLRLFVEELAERSMIFLYISIPVSMVAIISLVIRNI